MQVLTCLLGQQDQFDSLDYPATHSVTMGMHCKQHTEPESAYLHLQISLVTQVECSSTLCNCCGQNTGVSHVWLSAGLESFCISSIDCRKVHEQYRSSN